MFIYHSLERRQQWPSPVTTAIGEWAIHFRFLGVNPTVPYDLIASMLLCLAFVALIGGCVFVARNKMCRTVGLYTVFVASIFFFLAFAIRAGISNSSNPTKSSFIVESLFLVFGQLCVFDAWMERMVDELLDFQDDNKKIDLRGPDTLKGLREVFQKHIETKISLITRVIVVPLCIILYFVGYLTIPDPSVGFQTVSKNVARGAASFLIIVMLCTMQLVTLKTACFEQPPWLPFLILYGISLLIWLPAAYAFCLVAAADTSSFIREKTFFNLSFGLAHILAIAGLIFMHRQKPIWDYRGEHAPVSEEEKEAA